MIDCYAGEDEATSGFQEQEGDGEAGGESAGGGQR